MTAPLSEKLSLSILSYFCRIILKKRKKGSYRKKKKKKKKGLYCKDFGKETTNALTNKTRAAVGKELVCMDCSKTINY